MYTEGTYLPLYSWKQNFFSLLEEQIDTLDLRISILIQKIPQYSLNPPSNFYINHIAA